MKPRRAYPHCEGCRRLQHRGCRGCGCRHLVHDQVTRFLYKLLGGVL